MEGTCQKVLGEAKEGRLFRKQKHPYTDSFLKNCLFPEVKYNADRFKDKSENSLIISAWCFRTLTEACVPWEPTLSTLLHFSGSIFRGLETHFEGEIHCLGRGGPLGRATQRKASFLRHFWGREWEGNGRLWHWLIKWATEVAQRAPGKTKTFII